MKKVIFEAICYFLQGCAVFGSIGLCAFLAWLVLPAWLVF